MDESNEELFSLYSQENEDDGIGNGYLCPDCDNELVDINPLVTILDKRSKKEIGCNKCGYRGFRFI